MTSATDIAAVTLLLASEFAIVPDELTEGPDGTATRNYVATTASGERWFVKTYPSGADLEQAGRAAEVSEYARLRRVPVAPARYTKHNRLVAASGTLALSVTAYIAGAETAEGWLSDGRWERVGEAVGRLHRSLARYPLGPPRPGPRDRAVDPGRNRSRLQELIRQYEATPPRTEFERWAPESARERLAALPVVERLLEKVPEVMTSQIVHGDLSGPNVLLRGQGVAAVIDFLSPGRRSPVTSAQAVQLTEPLVCSCPW